jgi:hypothetical protein
MIGQAQPQIPMGHCPNCGGGAKKLVQIKTSEAEGIGGENQLGATAGHAGGVLGVSLEGDKR